MLSLQAPENDAVGWLHSMDINVDVSCVQEARVINGTHYIGNVDRKKSLFLCNNQQFLAE